MDKEIGIEDLVGYLNRYHSFPGFQYCYDGIDKRIYIQKNYPGFETQEEWVENERIISKRFGFIKWLVENDKIDLGEKLFNLTKNDNRKSIICDLDNNDFSWEDTFLMLLSISDTPIEDLISYLK